MAAPVWAYLFLAAGLLAGFLALTVPGGARADDVQNPTATAPPADVETVPNPAISPDPTLLLAYASPVTARFTPDRDIALHPNEWLTPEKPALSSSALSAYAAHYTPTDKRIALAKKERTCLAQAIYHEARGEPDAGQWAVANVILNRVSSRRYPDTICGVVYQNASAGLHRCQFSFACDGLPDGGGIGNRIVRESWTKANVIAMIAFKQYQNGVRPDYVPATTLFYHTKSVDPIWSTRLKKVATIGHHIFYASR